MLPNGSSNITISLGNDSCNDFLDCAFGLSYKIIKANVVMLQSAIFSNELKWNLILDFFSRIKFFWRITKGRKGAWSKTLTILRLKS